MKSNGDVAESCVKIGKGSGKMSVRRNVSKSGAGDFSSGTRFLRGVAFWIFLAVLSFVVGLFVVSPLINAASGIHGASPNPTANSVTNSAGASSHASPPEENRSTQTLPPAPRRSSTDDNIAITPDSAQRDQPQPARSVDEAADAPHPTVVDNADRDKSTDNRSSLREERRSRRNDDAQNADSPDSSNTEKSAKRDSSDDTPRRPRRQRDEASAPASRTNRDSSDSSERRDSSRDSSTDRNAKERGDSKSAPQKPGDIDR